MYGWLGRLGVLMPANNTVLEPEWYRVLPEGVSAHGARMVSSGGPTPVHIASMAAHIPDGIAGLRGKVDAYGYACMTTSLLQPPGWHERYHALTDGVPFLPAGESLVYALGYLGARRIGVFSPYFADVAALVPPWFARFGIEVVHQINVPFTPEQVVAQRLDDHHALIQREFAGRPLDALATLGTDLATFHAIDRFEAELGVPVVPVSLALLWSMLCVVGVLDAPAAPGRLFQRPGRVQASAPGYW